MPSREDARFVDFAQISAMTGLSMSEIEALVSRHGLRPQYIRNRRTFDLDAVWSALDADRAAVTVVGGEAAA